MDEVYEWIDERIKEDGEAAIYASSWEDVTAIKAYGEGLGMEVRVRPAPEMMFEVMEWLVSIRPTHPRGWGILGVPGAFQKREGTLHM